MAVLACIVKHCCTRFLVRAGKHRLRNFWFHVEIDVGVIEVSVAKQPLDHLGIVALCQQSVGKRASPGVA